jgi:hypothetical protein
MMHERFSALVDKAQELSYKEYEKRLTGYSREDLFNQIFAELIVRECVDKIETYRIPVGNSAVGEMAAEWTHDALWQIRDDIKQHFGVE